VKSKLKRLQIVDRTRKHLAANIEHARIGVVHGKEHAVVVVQLVRRDGRVESSFVTQRIHALAALREAGRENFSIPQEDCSLRLHSFVPKSTLHEAH